MPAENASQPASASAAEIPLGERILQELARQDGQTARQLSRTLGVPKGEVNSLLYGALKNRLTQDSKYAWSLRKSQAVEAAPNAVSQDTPLAKLADYYLDCLARDGAVEVSVFATSRYDNGIDYAEIPALPLEEVDPGNILAERSAGALAHSGFGRRMSVYLGYPVRLGRFRSKNNNWYEKVEPILLFELERQQDGQLNLDLERPLINLSVLKSLSGGQEGSALSDEWISLGQELGLASVNAPTASIDDLALRLRSVRPEWDWMEETDPSHLSSKPPIRLLQNPGIYNRAVIVRSEAPRFTKGLEQELASLRSIPVDQVSHTALGAWISGITKSKAESSQEPLIEVVPLNQEQRAAVLHGLTESLTVITGPPGTGKSQVVTALLANAAYRGLRVLFASKNNKAVDVVEDRINALGDRPSLLRLGSNRYLDVLSDYLARILGITSQETDRARLTEVKKEREKLLSEMAVLDKEVQSTIAARNACDEVDREVESIRNSVGASVFATMRHMDPGPLNLVATSMSQAVRGADRAENSFFVRVFWRVVRRSRIEALEHAAKQAESVASSLGVDLPTLPVGEESIPSWRSACENLEERARWTAQVRDYEKALQALNKAIPIEEVEVKRRDAQELLAVNGQELWRLWTGLISDRMSAEDRQLLAQYATILKMVAQNPSTVASATWRQYYQLSNKVVSVLPCWAITALSAHGRIPLDPGYFDLVVIDEASQCDIASTLPLLFRAKRAVIIGDPQQLRHITQLPVQVDQLLLEQRGLLERFLEWSYSTCSLYSLAASRVPTDAIVMLRDHHRSHADIIGFSNEKFYDGQLRVATRYDRLIRANDGPAVRWIEVQGKAETIRGGWANQAEAEATVMELRRLVLEQGYKGSVGVVSPFRGQANLISELITRDGPLHSVLSSRDFLVHTAHGFQGDERDLMIFSPVVTSHMPRNTAGWLDRTPNLFNVAITRARGALIVVGDKGAAASHGIRLLESFAGYVGGLQAPGAPSVSNTSELGPEYPKVSTNATISEWEHVFYRALYQEGIRTIPQYPVEKYLVDLVLVSGGRRLAIEVDGEAFHRAWDGELCRRDQIRNQRLMELGWDVMRFWVYQIRDDMNNCIRRVQGWLSQNG